MLYHLLYPLKDIFFVFNIFKYITFRSAMATLTSFVFSLLLGPWIINKLTKYGIGANIRKKEDSQRLYELHRHKEGIPTMGGIMMVVAIILSTLLWARWDNLYVILTIFVCIWLAVLGFIDDYFKLKGYHPRGIAPSVKLVFQIILGLIIGTILYIKVPKITQLDIPFLKEVRVELGIFYILFVILVITGSSNAVNLTDGLDGLAIGIVIMVAFAFSILSYVAGNIKFSNYLFIPYIRGAGELTVFCASILGAGLGFLWFNCYPASVFMGDVGALALGGTLGAIAVFIKKELLLTIVGGIFVLEAISVILQVGSFKLRGKRVFKIAPLHHHFQFLGWPEPKIVVRFWILAALLSLLTVVTLKIR
ncbi:MAG: phospho-N-acetylmuramoyl-pentapeptide-transferase [Candidatus Omnitrophica bacterium]|nr:phospho-N-acetylmuramoyl-pentapeptide-transferase [Candidatus Omnitrophota bacterium]